MMLKISKCPTCGSRKIRLVRGEYRGSFRGKPYIARNVAYHHCPVCGEQLFGPEAMRQIEAARPRRRRRVA